MSKVNGNYVKERLESLVEQAALEERTAKNSLKGAESQLTQNAAKKATQIAIMARVHLETLRTGNSRLRPITQEVSNLLAKRQADFETLKDQLVMEQESLEQEQVALRTARQTLESRESQRNKEMASNEELKGLREQGVTLFAAVKEKEELVESITSESKSKVRAYHEDPFFMHLHNSGFGTENSTGKWLFRGIDNWLASRINYRQSAQNYKFLNELPIKALEALQAVNEQNHAVLVQIDKIVDQIEHSSGLDQAQMRLESVGQRLKEREKSIRAGEEAVELHEAGGDQALKHILSIISKAMESMSLQTLDRLAGDTDNHEDELALSTYRSLVESETRLRGEIASMQNRYENAAHRNKRATSLQEFCDDRGYDGSKRVYDNNFDFQSLVNGYMLGQIEQSMLGSQLERQSQVIREPEPSYNSGYSGYSGGSTSSPRDDDSDTYKRSESSKSSDSGWGNSDSVSDSGNNTYRNSESI